MNATLPPVARRTLSGRIADLLPDALREAIVALRGVRPLADRECPLCGHVGRFRAFGRPPRGEARCPRCLSLERHRQFKLALDRGQIALDGAVIHFAPEPILTALIRPMASDYRTADLFQPADLRLNLEAIELPDASVDTVIANHVLEHVDDRKAAAEICRILKPGGRLIASVPIVEGWDETYENPAITTDAARNLHFGQEDHVRWFGRDFRERVLSGGFSRIDEITAMGEESVRYALTPGMKIFVFTR